MSLVRNSGNLSMRCVSSSYAYALLKGLSRTAANVSKRSILGWLFAVDDVRTDVVLRNIRFNIVFKDSLYKAIRPR